MSRHPINRAVSRRRVLGFGAAAMTAAAVGCGSSSNSDNTPASSPGNGASSATAGAGGAYKQNATLRAAIGSEGGSLDPMSVAGTGGGNWPNYTTHFAPALAIDPKTSRVESFACDWEWTDNNTALLLKAHPGVKFHNGETLNADVLKFNVDRVRGKPDYSTDFQSGSASLFASVDHVEIVDDMTVKVVTATPDASLPSKFGLGNVPLVPRQYILDGGDKAMVSKPVGYGPFQFVSHQSDVSLVSARFKDFFNPQGSPEAPMMPYIQGLQQKVMPEVVSRASAIEAGEIDIAADITPDIGKSYANKSGFQVFYLPGDQPMHIQPNTKVATAPDGSPNPLRDVRVRKAMNMAIDVDTIIKTILTGKENYCYGFSSQTVGFPLDDLKKARFPFDPKQAKALLEQAGYGSGFELPFIGPIGRWPNSDEVMKAVAGYLKDVGISTKIQTSQYQTWVTQFQAHQWYGISFMGMTGGADPDLNLRYGYTKDAPYCNSYDPDLGIDDLTKQIEATFEADAREKLISKAILELYKDATWIYLYEPVSVALASDKVDWDFYGKVIAVPQYWRIRLKA